MTFPSTLLPPLHQQDMKHSALVGDLDAWLLDVCVIAQQAGQVISQYYHANDDVGVKQKEDGTPVTIADQAADDVINDALQSLTPDVPVITEESVAEIPFEDRESWKTYWLVDPLDGTKEFIAGTGEYSVNIALIDQQRPVLGVVYAPEVGVLYAACDTPEGHAKKIALPVAESCDRQEMAKRLGAAKKIQVAKMSPAPEAVKVAVSRRHGGMLQQFMAQLGHSEKVKMGSAIKTCLVAEGAAHVYPRFGPTSLWDTAASQMILESAGGAVLNAAGHPLRYVQTPTLLNPFFIAVGDYQYNWPQFPEVM